MNILKSLGFRTMMCPLIAQISFHKSSNKFKNWKNNFKMNGTKKLKKINNLTKNWIRCRIKKRHPKQSIRS